MGIWKGIFHNMELDFYNANGDVIVLELLQVLFIFQFRLDGKKLSSAEKKVC